MTHIISTTHGYVITDGLTFVKTFWIHTYGTRRECFYAAVSSAVMLESVWGHRNNQAHHGRIVRKAGIIREGLVGRPHKVKV